MVTWIVLAQSVQGYVEEGKWKTVSPGILNYSMKDTPIDMATSSMRLSKTASSHYTMLYSQTDVESYTTGYWVYHYPSSFNALDFSGDGKKAFAVTNANVESGEVTTYYISSQSYQPVWTIGDVGYGEASVKTQIINAQITGTQEPEYIVWRLSSNDIPSGSTLFRIHSKLSSTPLFKGDVVADTNIAYIFPVNFLESSIPNFDLNNNGLNEFMKVQIPKDAGFGAELKISIFDNLTLLGTITANPFFSYNVTTTNDINSDGKPEVLVVTDYSPKFYQWNSSGGNFQQLATLEMALSIWGNPENIDADANKEFVVQNQMDSLVVYSNTFSSKFRIGVPSEYVIVQYFIANVNASPNKELIVVAAKDFSQYLTCVYDFSASVDPIWTDMAFKAQAVEDFRKAGRCEILGITSLGTARLVDGMNNFQPVWTLSDGTYSLVGPFIPNPYNVTDAMFKFFAAVLGYPFPGTSAIDFDNNGTNDIIFKNTSPSYSTALIIVNANGVVRDTIPIEASGNNYIQAFDFNNNGRPEHLITNLLSKKVFLLEHDGIQWVQQENIQPNKYYLAQNYPNPFNPTTTIKYDIPVGTYNYTSLRVYDMLGREVATLVNEQKEAGSYEVIFNASHLASGIYFYKLTAGNYFEVKKLTVMK